MSINRPHTISGLVLLLPSAKLCFATTSTVISILQTYVQVFVCVCGWVTMYVSSCIMQSEIISMCDR